MRADPESKDQLLAHDRGENYMTYDEWWNSTDKDGTPFVNYTFGEEAWTEAQRETWKQIFQIVSDKGYLTSRDFIKELEAARGAAGYGP